MASTEVYRALMAALEGRRLELGLSMATVNDVAGLSDGFFAKMIYPDTPSGRQARWETVQLAFEALYGEGFTINVVPGDRLIKKVTSAPIISTDISENARNIRHWRHRAFFVELGKKGAEARSKMPKHELSAIYRKAAKKRWQKVRDAKRQARKHHEANAQEREVRHVQSKASANRRRDPPDVRLRSRERDTVSESG